MGGDGEDVWQLVAQLQPAAIFLDFDRTLATTKAGASPLEGNHSVDADLAAVCGDHDCVHIVTRNSRKEDIDKFLEAKEVSVAAVRCLKPEGRRNKAEIIGDIMASLSTQDGRAGGIGLFVDDDIAELTEPSLAALAHKGVLHRLLFVRTGGKE